MIFRKLRAQSPRDNSAANIERDLQVIEERTGKLSLLLGTLKEELEKLKMMRTR